MLWNKKPEVKCEHDECAECHHLIAKGSCQVVVKEYRTGFMYGTSDSYIYCDLHKKPYDLITVGYNYKVRYDKKNEPYRRVNEDGTDYKEPKQKKPATT